MEVVYIDNFENLYWMKKRSMKAGISARIKLGCVLNLSKVVESLIYTLF